MVGNPVRIVEAQLRLRKRGYGLVLVVMAGLPGTGKSAIAQELAARVGAVIVSKDKIREAAFDAAVRDYSPAQDDLCMEMVYQAVGYILGKSPETTVIIDGRTFSKHRQIERLLTVASALGVAPRVIECVCDEDVARARLESADETSAHPAANRSFELYCSLRAQAEPFEVPRLTVDTSRLTIQEAALQSLSYLAHPPPASS